MQRFYCYLMIGAYCLYSFFHLPVTTYMIAGFLAAVIILCFSYFFNQKAATAVLAVCYIIPGFFLPELYLFFPLLTAELGRMKLYIPMILAAFGLTMHVPPLNFQHLAVLPGRHTDSIFTGSTEITPKLYFYILLGCSIAWLLNMLCSQITDLNLQSKKTRDDSAEMNFLLQKKNRLLIENQDYAIHAAMLQEKNRIAREIHDNAGHMLSRCILLTGMIKTINTDEKCVETLQLLDEELSKTMNSMRDSVHDLHKEAINLKEKIEELISEFEFCPVNLRYDMGTNVPSNIKYTFLAIVKEALTNVAKHSNATNVQMRMTEHPAIYQLAITDNGTDIAQEPTQHDGIGLQNIRDRVDALHGTLQLIQENGYRIFISIPKEQNES